MDREIWDEDRWETFLQEWDRHLERYMTLLFRYMSEDPPSGEPGSEAREDWERRLRDYLETNGIRPDEDLPRHWDGDDGEVPGDSAPSEFDDPISDLERLPAYEASHQLTTRVLAWSNRLPGRLKDSTLVQFCSYITQVSANVAKGHGMGYEMDVIGGNIACVKRALSAANAALELLREMKESAYMDRTCYRDLYEDLYHIRNDLGIYVQDLRDRFRLGID